MQSLDIQMAVGASTRRGGPAANQKPDVEVVQTLLKRHGMYGGAVDGWASPSLIASIHEFQKRKMGKWRNSDGRVDPGGATLRKLNSMPKTGKTYRVLHGKDYHRIGNGTAVDRMLLDLTWGLCQYLIDEELVLGDIYYTQGVRLQTTAHRWSTAYNIRRGRIHLEALQALTDGKDLDGNVWYQASWEEGLEKGPDGKWTAEARKALMEKAKAHATSIWTGKVAAEGYKLSDPRSKPNVHSVVSNHIAGKAVDISIPWKPGAAVPVLVEEAALAAQSLPTRIVDGGNNDSAANQLVHAFGLVRPVQSEKWHFQVASTRGLNADRHNNLNGFTGGTCPAR